MPSQPKEPSDPIGVLTLGPAAGLPWYAIFAPIHIHVLACDATGHQLAYGRVEAMLSAGPPAIIIAFLTTVAAYVLCALGYNQAPKGQRLNPIWLARDFTGRASLAQMQIIFFSVIVLFLVIYILLRTGVLASLSQNVLLLLGIAGLGSVAGQIGTYQTSRLDYANIAWAIKKKWMNDGGWQVEKPRPSDLVTTGGEFDPYKFQMLAFSAVVGIALLNIGVNGLADFAIPVSLLGVIGLSQVTYVSGKVFANGSMTELDDAMTKLRETETKFLDAKSAAPAGAAEPTNDEKKYLEDFKDKVRSAWIIFKQQIPWHLSDADARLEPGP